MITVASFGLVNTALGAFNCVQLDKRAKLNKQEEYEDKKRMQSVANSIEKHLK